MSRKRRDKRAARAKTNTLLTMKKQKNKENKEKKLFLNKEKLCLLLDGLGPSSCLTTPIFHACFVAGLLYLTCAIYQGCYILAEELYSMLLYTTFRHRMAI